MTMEIKLGMVAGEQAWNVYYSDLCVRYVWSKSVSDTGT